MLNINTAQRELSTTHNQKIKYFDYLFVLILILYAGGANTFVQSASIKTNQVAFFIPILLSIILAMRKKIVFNKRFYYLILGMGIYFLASSIKYHSVHITIFINFLALFFIVYTVVKALHSNFFIIYEYLIYNLALIGLAMWSFQFILGGDSLFNILGKIPGIESFSYVTGRGLNILIYTIQPSSFFTLDNLGSTIPRNCGFAWEPGVFSVYVCLAIFINLFITKSDKKSKFRFWILVTALVTTQSTTGFIIFIIIMAFYYANKRLNVVLLTIPIIVVAMLYIFSLPFMGDKIVNIANEANEMDMVVENSIGREETENPQRFVSFMIGFQDFLNNPILGIQGGENESWTKKIDANISVISGIGDLLAENGLVGFLFFSILSFKSSSFLAKHYNYKGKQLLFLIIIAISISYTIILRPLITIFWMFSFFESHKTYHKMKLEQAQNINRINL